MNKARVFLILKIPGLTPGRAFIWPHILQDRDWLPDWKRKKQEQIKVIEAAPVLTELKEIKRRMEKFSHNGNCINRNGDEDAGIVHYCFHCATTNRLERLIKEIEVSE